MKRENKLRKEILEAIEKNGIPSNKTELEAYLDSEVNENEWIEILKMKVPYMEG